MMMLLKWLVILQFFIREIVISQSLYGQFDKAYDQFDKACAPNWSSKSCMCRGRISSELIPEMKCQNITDSNQFDKAFNYTWGKKPKVIHLSVVNCTTAHISANTFKMLQFVQIHFHDSNLGKIDKLAFLESRNTAVSVSFTNNNFSTNFGLNFLVPLRLLTFVYFDKTNYLSISYESFGDLPVLSDIIIRETKSFKMDKLAFSRLPQLKSIGLMTNGIEKLEKNMFTTSNYTRPVVINLSFNQIREIDPDALIDLYTNDLDLQYNKLTTLKQAAFEPLLEFMLRYQNSTLLTNESCYIQKLKLDNGKIFKHGKEWQFVGSDSVMLKHGSELRFQCVEKGYELFVRNTAVNKDFAVTKCETGRWVGQIPVCKPARCSCAKLQSNLDDNGLEAVTCEDAIASGDLVDLKCVSDDSTPIGLLFAECERGEWGVVNATCIG